MDVTVERYEASIYVVIDASQPLHPDLEQSHLNQLVARIAGNVTVVPTLI